MKHIAISFPQPFRWLCVVTLAIGVALSLGLAVGAETPADIPIDETAFPDATFRTYISDNFDKDGNGTLSDTERTAVKYIIVNSQEITTLRGIEHFTDLTYLSCFANTLTELDISRQTALTYLDCSQNALTELNLSQNTALQTLSCSRNPLSTLDLSHNAALTSLYCHNTSLTSLDLSYNPALTLLNCQLSTLTSLNLSKNAALERLYCNGNRLTSLDLTANTKLTAADIGDQTREVTFTQPGKLNITSLAEPARVSVLSGGTLDPASGILTWKNDTSSVTYSYATGYGDTVMEVNLIPYLPAVPLDEETFPDAVFRRYISDKFDRDKNGVMSATELLSVNTLRVDSMGITSLCGIEHFPALTILTCSNNRLTFLDLSQNRSLTVFAGDDQAPIIPMPEDVINLSAFGDPTRFTVRFGGELDPSTGILTLYQGATVLSYTYATGLADYTLSVTMAFEMPDSGSCAEAASLAGDLNGDDAVNNKDVVLLRRRIIGILTADITERAADVNADGTVNNKDIVILRRYIVGIPGITLASPAVTHSFSATWTTSATHHWHAAACTHTDETANMGEHLFGTGSICRICGSVRQYADGSLIYRENFDSHSNSKDTAAVLHTIGWTRLNKDSDGVYSETDAEFSIIDGKLYFDNYDQTPLPTGDTRVRGKDGYYGIDVLDQDTMKPIAAKKYTLQYDITYTDAGSTSRYAVLVTECAPNGQRYNSFHFRISGYGNHQCHYDGAWKTYHTSGPNTLNPSSQKNDGSDAAPLSKKLLGLDYSSKVFAFRNVTVTIRQQWEPGVGHHIYMKTAEMKDFIKVSEPSPSAEAARYIGWDGYAIRFKIGSAVDGWLDNIALWSGWGSMPAD